MFKASCKVNGSNDGCIDDPNYVAQPTPTPISSCSSVQEPNLTYYKCVEKLNTCSVNANKTACVTA